MRIAFFNDVAAIGGGEIWVLGACRHLVDGGPPGHGPVPVALGALPACLADGIDSFSYLRMSGIPLYEPLFHALRRRDIDVLYCTVIGTFCEASARHAGRSPRTRRRRRQRRWC